MEQRIQISPSLLSADFAALGESARQLIAANPEYLHFDVMDGHFVPNLTFGAQLVRALRPLTSIPFDVHLMVEYPERIIPEFAAAGSNMITVHPEVCYHLHRVVHQIKELGLAAAVALNPATPIEAVEWVLADLGRVLVMTVNPGFGGQEFIEGMLPKISRLRQMQRERGLAFEIAVDGGIHEPTIPLVVEAGADVLIAGSAVFAHADGPRAGVEQIRRFAAAVSGMNRHP